MSSRRRNVRPITQTCLTLPPSCLLQPGDALDSERLRPFLSLDNIKTLTILVPEHPSNGVWYCDLGRVSKGRPRGSLLGDVPDPNSGLTTNRPKRTIRFVPKSSILGSLDDVPVKARKVKVGIIDLSPSDASSWSQVSSLVIVDSFSRFFHDPAARHMFARHMFNPIVPTTSPPSRRLKSTPKRTQIQPFISSRYLPEHWAFAPPSVEGVVDLRNVTIPGDEATLEGALIGLLDRDKKQDRVEKRPDRGPFKVWFASQEAKRLMERKLVSRDNRVGGRYMSGGTMVIKERDQA